MGSNVMGVLLMNAHSKALTASPWTGRTRSPVGARGHAEVSSESSKPPVLCIARMLVTRIKELFF